MRLWLMEMMCANSTMTANFATSEGCRLPPMGRNIHRFAPFSSGMKSTTMTDDRDGHDGPRKFEDVVIHVGRDEHHDHAHSGEAAPARDEVEAVALEADTPWHSWR